MGSAVAGQDVSLALPPGDSGHVTPSRSVLVSSPVN